MKIRGASLIPIIGAAVGGSFLAYLLMEHGVVSARASAPAAVSPPAPATPACAYDIQRVSGFSHVRPLLSTGSACESPRLSDLRSSIGSLVNELKATRQVHSVSVYVRDLVQDDWMSYNGAETYAPGSLLKVPLLMMFLAMADADPTLLKETWTCEKVDAQVPQHTAYPAEQARLNTSYSVEQVLELAIVHSDNRATMMLFRHASLERYTQLFVDLGLPRPDRDAANYLMTTKDYSVFLKALYTSATLSPMGSERALGYMTRSTFRSGLVAGLPPDVEVAHKFGEAGNVTEKELHESGLVYADGHPYLITVMTRGEHVEPLAEAIASISRLVYGRMAGEQQH